MKNEFQRYLEYGMRAHGFARAICETCGDELLLPFSCKYAGSVDRATANSMLAGTGLVLGDTQPVLHFARRLDVLAWPLVSA